MIRKTALFIGLLVSTLNSYTAIDANTCVYTHAQITLTSHGDTQQVTFKGVICDDKMLNLQSASGSIFIGVLTETTDEGVSITFSSTKSIDSTSSIEKDIFLMWDHEYVVTLTNSETGDELVLIMTVSQQ